VSYHAAAGHNDAIDLAELQVWTDTFIDFSNPGIRSLFIDSSGKPVDPAMPAGVFGTQAILLRRNKDKGLHFDTNEGFGGPIIKVGTVSDLSPGPGQ
jgi:hypothetical protein